MPQHQSSLIRTATAAEVGVLLCILTNIASLTVYFWYLIAICKMQNRIVTQTQQNAILLGEYQVIMRFGSSQALKIAKEHERQIFDVTLATQCSVNNLYHLIETLRRWNGPISVSLFAPKDHYLHAIFGAKSLTECFSVVDISFHIVYPQQESPIFSEKAIELWSNYFRLKDLKGRCNYLLDTLQSITGLNYALGDTPYPHNTLRNIAKRSVKSTHLFLLDVDVMPSKDIRDSFLTHIVLSREDGLKTYWHSKVVYITPVFEIRVEAEMPSTKSELMQAVNMKQARVFHIETCPVCHKPTKNEEWLAIAEDRTHPVAFEVDWSPSWEPFYISWTSVPDYSERFKQYGYDRISQICELHVAGYSFIVLANSFVVHRGMKTPGNFHETKNQENKRNLKIFNKEFKRDLNLKYPQSQRSCGKTYKRSGRAEVNFHSAIQQKSKNIEANQDREL